jgi:AcrR family transcriptional regulator
MSRTANEQRPEELKSAIVQYLIEHGLSDLSLRPLAKAVGSSPRVLLYYFGSKEKMVVDVLAAIRRRQQASYREMEAATFAEACLVIWKQISARDSVRLFRLYFEAFGIALRHPQLYEVFLRSTIEDWLQIIAEPLIRDGYERKEARAFATVVLAGLRGFMQDYCATGERKRVDLAVRLWLPTLDSMLATLKKAGTA